MSLSDILILISRLPPAMLAACVAYACMFAGFVVRRTSLTWHVRLMLFAIALDLSLVAILQTRKNVIETALGQPLDFLQAAHVAASAGAAALYIPVLIFGSLLWWLSDYRFRKWHVRFALTAFVLRTIGFATMFSMLGR